MSPWLQSRIQFGAAGGVQVIRHDGGTLETKEKAAISGDEMSICEEATLRHRTARQPRQM